MWLEVWSPALWVKARWLPAVLSEPWGGYLRGSIQSTLGDRSPDSLKAGAGDMDLEGSHIKATADTVRADDLSKERVRGES